MPNNSIDQHVGMRLRMRRLSIGASQSELGDALGVTFQQIQKYERGANRLGASSLYRAAMFLNVDVEYFFDGLKPTASLDPADKRQEAAIRDFLYSSYGTRIVNAFSAIQSDEMASIIASLLEAVKDRDEPGVAGVVTSRSDAD